MPFIVKLSADTTPMYYREGVHGSITLTPNKAKATQYDEARADALAADHNRYTLGEDALVVGVAQGRTRIRLGD